MQGSKSDRLTSPSPTTIDEAYFSYSSTKFSGLSAAETYAERTYKTMLDFKPDGGE
jgi:hypothetical protein